MSASCALATPHALATRAGIDSFAAGGNAIDAAITAAAVLTVIYPHQCALGGDLFALVRTPTQKAVSVNGSGVLPRRVDVEAWRRKYSQAPATGPDSITVPGLVAGWRSLAQLGARLTPKQWLAPAIALASDGATVSASLARGLGLRQQFIKADPGLAAVFSHNGDIKKQGDIFKQPALAATLAAMAGGGLEVFYQGPIAQRLAHGLQALGSVIEADDLAAHQSLLTAPLALEKQGLRILTSPPNSQGFVFLETLAALLVCGRSLDRMNDELDLTLAACLMAAGDRDRYLGDPTTSAVPLDQLLDDAQLKARLAGRHQQAKADAQRVAKAAPAHGDTVAVCAMDDDGNAVSLIQSVFQSFGAGLLEPATGIIMHNRARGFSLDPKAANEVKPGTRPAHTLVPVLIEEGDEVSAVVGTMGGRAQPQILTQILPAVLRSDQPLAESLAAPRWVFGAADMDFASLGVAYEKHAPGFWRDRLAMAGLPLHQVATGDERMGHANIVRRRRQGGLESAADPRSDGSGAVYERAA
ncbi:MAG: gamma-glutamyltransferase [Sphingomonadales bacterium]